MVAEKTAFEATDPLQVKLISDSFNIGCSGYICKMGLVQCSHIASDDDIFILKRELETKHKVFPWTLVLAVSIPRRGGNMRFHQFLFFQPFYNLGGAREEGVQNPEINKIRDRSL